MSRTSAYHGEGLPGDPALVGFFGGYWLLAGLAMHCVGIFEEGTAFGLSAKDTGNILLVGGFSMLLYALADRQLESEGQGPRVAHA